MKKSVLQHFQAAFATNAFTAARLQLTWQTSSEKILFSNLDYLYLINVTKPEKPRIKDIQVDFFMFL